MMTIIPTKELTKAILRRSLRLRNDNVCNNNNNDVRGICMFQARSVSSSFLNNHHVHGCNNNCDGERYQQRQQRQQQQQQLHQPMFMGVNIIPPNNLSNLHERHEISKRYISRSSKQGGHKMSTISSSSSSNHHNSKEEEEEEDMTRRERTVKNMKKASAKIKPAAKKGASLLQQYGPVFLGTYFTVYFATLGSLWGAITYELVDVTSVFYYLGKFGWHSVAEGGGAVGGGDGGGGVVVGAGDVVDAAGAVVDVGTANGGSTEVSTAAAGVSDAGTEANIPPSVVTEEERESNEAVKFIVSLLEKYDWTRPYAGAAAKNPHVVNLGVAWVATKLTEPIRFGVTALVLPKVARLVGRVPPEDQQQEEEEDKHEEEEEEMKEHEVRGERFDCQEEKLKVKMEKEEKEYMKR